MIGRWPLGDVGAKFDTRESNLNYLEFVGTAELLLTFPDGSSAAFECGKRNDDCKAVCLAIVAGADGHGGRRRGLCTEWQRDWLADNGRS